MKPFTISLAAKPAIALTLAFAGFGSPNAAHAGSHTTAAEHGVMHVTKSATCGCCGAWVALARREGYDVEVTDTADVTSAKLDADIPGNLWACHTATIDDYVVEGHMPFAALKKLLTDRPDVAGISVPGMPFGSPGMGEDPAAEYQVIAFGGTAGAGQVFFGVGQ